MTERPAVALIPPLGEGRDHFEGVRSNLAGLQLVDLDPAALGGPPVDGPDPAAPGGPAARAPQPPRRTAAHDAERAAAQLARHLGPGRPVIVVGASYGGLVARLLAVRPNSLGIAPVALAGIVLVDSPHEYLARTMSGLVGPRRAVPAGTDHPPGVAVASDRVDLHASFRQAGRLSAPGSLGDVPLVVLASRPRPWSRSGTWAGTADRLWRVHQRMLMPLSSDSVYEEVTTGEIWLCREHPEVVSRYVRELADRIR